MKTLVIERTSAAKASWVIGVLFVLWIGFVLLADRPAPKPTKPDPIPPPSLKLYEVGLPEDPDLQGLPGFFGVWADRAEWKEGKTRFAYRHPVTGEFSFYFEAIKTSNGFRFREIAKPKLDPRGAEVWSEDLGEDCPFKFVITDPQLRNIPASGYRAQGTTRQPLPTEPERVKVSVPPARLDVPVPPLELKTQADKTKPDR